MLYTTFANNAFNNFVRELNILASQRPKITIEGKIQVQDEALRNLMNLTSALNKLFEQKSAISEEEMKRFFATYKKCESGLSPSVKNAIEQIHRAISEQSYTQATISKVKDPQQIFEEEIKKACGEKHFMNLPADTQMRILIRFKGDTRLGKP